MKAFRPFQRTFSIATNTSAQPKRTIFRAASSSSTVTNHNRLGTRSFVTNPFATVQSLTASRTIDYPTSVVYDVVSDVNAYSSYIPYCRSSRVTKTSEPASISGQKYPEEAEIVVGFHDNVSESFWSRIYCAPYEAIETVCGPRAETTLSGQRIAHHHKRPQSESDPTRSGSVLSHLLTRWTFRQLCGQSKSSSPRPVSGDSAGTTEIRLVIEYQFANPIYAALSQAAAPRVADKIIEAFEQRVQLVMAQRARAEGTITS